MINSLSAQSRGSGSSLSRANLGLKRNLSSPVSSEAYVFLFFQTTKAFLPTMLEINHGHIVTVASSLGLFSTAGVEDYCASKFGVVGFHESLSHELKAAEKDGIKTTLVCPYLVDTGMFRGCRIRSVKDPPQC
ncbi:hypothetical protein Celaphus_00016311 [Cervus elaphus hippelaphus]|uniref:Uncharacterized protein n=1 Tax=Cervus elaphus hippelaphus TaxID=46360 RepID=A0A212CEJ6_CEREH|nr:hypothetical protein Celaphus_00016311 [Cervus elaphus hippelaphus]